jgi:hypothetical protein
MYFLNSCCSKWGFGRKWDKISLTYFGCASLFLANFDNIGLFVAKHLKVGCKKLEGTKVCITRSNQYLQVEDLLNYNESVVSKSKN